MSRYPDSLIKLGGKINRVLGSIHAAAPCERFNWQITPMATVFFLTMILTLRMRRRCKKSLRSCAVTPPAPASSCGSGSKTDTQAATGFQRGGVQPAYVQRSPLVDAIGRGKRSGDLGAAEQLFGGALEVFRDGHRA